jgi:hypothetical protein
MLNLVATSVVTLAGLLSTTDRLVQSGDLFPSMNADIRERVALSNRTTRVDVDIHGQSCNGRIPGSPTVFYRLLKDGQPLFGWTLHPGNNGNTADRNRGCIVPGASGIYVAEAAFRDNRGRFTVIGRTTFSVNGPRGQAKPTVGVGVCLHKFN